MSSSSHRPAALPSESVGAYEFVTELARGALGPLFGARVAAGSDEGRLVAIRRIPIGSSAREDVQRIEDTAKIACRLRHTKVATLLEAVVTDREILLVGDYVDGCSLSSLLRLAIAKRAPLPPAVALRIGLELLHGLRAVRETWKVMAPSGARVAPRGGVSPDNVFVAASGEVLLSEAGVAAVASTLVPFRTFPGILAYLSPEQVRDNGAQSIDERADVFSVGVILWELLANRPLFGEVERLDADPDDQSLALADRTLRDVQSMVIPALSSMELSDAPTVRAAVEVVERSLRRDPAARFASIDQMRVALLALKREVFANVEQVRTAIQALAGSEIAAQRAALGLPSEPAKLRTGSAPPRKQVSAQGAVSEQSSEQEAPNSSALRSLPRLPKPPSRSIPPPPPTRSFPPSSIPPPPSSIPPPLSTTPPPAPARSVRATSTPPPPPVRKTKASSVAPPGDVDNPPPSAASAPIAEPTAAAGFGEPLPPLPELPEADPPTAQAEPAEAAAPIAADDGAPRRPRARRLALVIAGVAGLIGLMGLLRVVLRPATPGDAESGPASKPGAQTAAAAPAADPPAKTTTRAAPAPPVPALAQSSVVPHPRENPSRAPTQAQQHADTAPGPTAPRESYRPPEVRAEPEGKVFRPTGI